MEKVTLLFQCFSDKETNNTILVVLFKHRLDLTFQTTEKFCSPCFLKTVLGISRQLVCKKFGLFGVLGNSKPDFDVKTR